MWKFKLTRKQLGWGFLTLAVLYHILPLTINLMAYTVNRPYLQAKVPLALAKTINEIYVIPTVFLAGPDSILSAPFKQVRDFLYQEGLRHIPENDVERDIWWVNLYFVEYNTCRLRHFPAVKSGTLSKADQRWWYQRTSEIAEKLQILAQKDDYQDPHIPYLRILRANMLATAYLTDRTILVNHFPEKQYTNTRTNQPFYEDGEEITKLFKVFLSYNEIRNKTFASGNRKALGFFQSADGVYRDDNLILQLYSSILLNEYLRKGRVTCEKSMAEDYVRTYKSLLHMANHEKNLSDSKRKSLKRVLNTKLENIVRTTIKDSCGWEI